MASVYNASRTVQRNHTLNALSFFLQIAAAMGHTPFPAMANTGSAEAVPGRYWMALVLTVLFGSIVAFGMRAQDNGNAVTGACHVSPIVSDLDRSARFYHDLIGLDLVPAPDPPGPLQPPQQVGPLPWDTDPGHLDLHGLPKARLRFIGARMPGVRCGVELVEFADAGQRPVHRRLQDPGATMLILLVRNIDAIFSRLQTAGVTVLTRGGTVMPVGPAKTRAVIVSDPDGHFIELAQLEPIPPTAAAAQSNVLGIRLRVTVPDIEEAASYYRQTLGLDLKTGDFTKDGSVMAMMGLPAAAEFRVATSELPGSPLLLEFIEFKGIDDVKTLGSSVQDPGSYRLQLNVRNIDDAVAALKKAGSNVISSGGVPVQMTFGTSPWRLAVVPDPNNLFLVLQQRIDR